MADNTSTPIIVKANGDREPFESGKLLQSLIRSGAAPQVAERITKRIAGSITSGDRTQQIYRRAFTELRAQKESIGTAARYSVKRALLELGPSGYPFEHFVGQIFTEMGYTTQTGIQMSGVCVPHEVDVFAEKETETLVGEAKYHNSAGMVSDVKVALYVDARFDDIQRKRNGDGDTRRLTKLLITNTKFSGQAVQYGFCRGLRMISWDYPQEGNLEDLIEQHHVHPISCLATLSSAQKRRLMDTGVVRCKQILQEPKMYQDLNLSSEETGALHRELQNLCGV